MLEIVAAVLLSIFAIAATAIIAGNKRSSHHNKYGSISRGHLEKLEGEIKSYLEEKEKECNEAKGNVNTRLGISPRDRYSREDLNSDFEEIIAAINECKGNNGKKKSAQERHKYQ